MTTDRLARISTARQWVADKSGKAQRDRYHLTAADIAEALGVRVSTVLSWEKGTSQPRGRVAVLWVQIFEDLATHAETQTSKAA